MKVPLGHGNRLVVGYCVRLEDRTAGRRRLKPLHSVLDQRSLLSPAMLRLTRWIADYYLCDWAAVLEAVLPAIPEARRAAGEQRPFLDALASGDVECASLIAQTVVKVQGVYKLQFGVPVLLWLLPFLGCLYTKSLLCG